MYRLKELRKQRGLTQQDVADHFMISRVNYTRYENDRTPPVEMLEKFADYYNVSVDYLLGRTDIPNIYIHKIDAGDLHGSLATTQKDLSPEHREQVRTKVQNAIKEDRGVKISASDLPSNRAELEALVQQIVAQALGKPNDRQ